MGGYDTFTMLLGGLLVPSRTSTHRLVVCALLILPAWAIAAGCEGKTSIDGDDLGGEGGYGAEFAEVESELDDLRKRTKKLVKENVECSEDSECDALAFGAKPCGGPWEYLPYSKTSEGADELLETATELRELERQYNEETGVQSDCSLAIRPDTECASGTCVAVKKR